MKPVGIVVFALAGAAWGWYLGAAPGSVIGALIGLIIGAALSLFADWIRLALASLALIGALTAIYFAHSQAKTKEQFNEKLRAEAVEHMAKTIANADRTYQMLVANTGWRQTSGDWNRRIFLSRLGLLDVKLQFLKLGGEIMDDNPRLFSGTLVLNNQKLGVFARPGNKGTECEVTIVQSLKDEPAGPAQSPK